jgi:hypothetical protein
MVGDTNRLLSLIQNMGSNALLVQEALTRLAPEPAAPPPAPLSPEAAWLKGWWSDLMNAFNAATVGAMARLAAQPAPERDALSAFRTQRIEPFRRLIAELAPLMQTLAGSEKYKSVADLFQPLRENMEEMSRQVDGLLEPAVVAPWPADVSLPVPDVSRMIDLSGPGLPRIDWAPVLEALEAVNQSAAAWYGAQPSAAPAAIGEALARFDTAMELRLVDLLTLKHALMTQPDVSGDLGRMRIQTDDQIQSFFRSQGFEEIDVRPGDPINPDCKVITSEPNPFLTPGTVLRVIVPGYRYRGNRRRMASVVTAQ